MENYIRKGHRMRNKNIAALCAVLGVVLLIIRLSPVIKKQMFSDAPLSNDMTLEELQKQKIQVTYVNSIESWNEQMIREFGKKQLKKSKKCPGIFIVKPTGNLYFNEGLILQEAKLEKVIKGKESSDTIWLRNGLHSTLTYHKKKKEVELSGMDRSFMQTDCEYLLFCEPQESNSYSARKIYTETDKMWFGCYNLTKSSYQVVSPENAYYDSSIEFYVDDKKLLNGFNEGKRKLVEYYVTEGRID
jgi:hypothetical protein